MFIHKWDKDDNIGKKYVFTNCFRKCPRTRSVDAIVPAYDLYKISFNACDAFNRQLHQRKWPHKSGGRNKGAGDGHQHKFAFACILQNTINLYHAVNKSNHLESSFQSQCILLADNLYAYATSL
jgi:hypothetical protein